MNDTARKIQFKCPTGDLAAYIDGELDRALELQLESHLAICKMCSAELNQQKQFLCNLNVSLRGEKEIELPANFAKQIVANAESTVSGLRRPRERYIAAFICVGLFLVVLFAKGAEAERMFSGVYAFFAQTVAVGGFLGHVFYSIFVGVVIVLRSIASQFHFDTIVGLALFTIFGATVVFISRKVMRLRRA